MSHTQRLREQGSCKNVKLMKLRQEPIGTVRTLGTTLGNLVLYPVPFCMHRQRLSFERRAAFSTELGAQTSSLTAVGAELLNLVFYDVVALGTGLAG